MNAIERDQHTSLIDSGATVLVGVLRRTNNGKYATSPFLLPRSRITRDFCSQKFLGVPFNISSYALLMHMVAQVCDLQVGDFVYTLGDYHIYKNHIAQVEELLSREPYPLPTLEIKDEARQLRGLEGLLDMRYEHLSLVGYQSHGKIAAAVAV